MNDEQFVETPPAGAAAWRDVWQHDRRYRPGRSWQGWLLRLFRRITGPDNDRQRDFNLALLDLVDDLRRQIDDVRRSARADVDSLQHDVRSGDDALSAEIGKTRAVIPVAAMRNDALIAALDQKIETLAVRVRDLTNPVAANADFVYRRIEDSLRGSEHEVRDSVAHYANLAREHGPLIDVGCGRGELLALVPGARGVDTNERSVADLKARGLDATRAGVPECFASFGDASIGSVAALHVVEHLPVELLFAFFRESARVLRDGGLLMIETPNAESLLVSASEFWRDPTHLAPRHPAALVLLAREHGFEIVECRAVHPFPEGTRIAILESDPPELQRVIHAINDRLFAPQDLRLIARRHR
ncbi:MAG TPA: methyltransferase domain-containing protein [Thermoanaerobaculia bacterium]|nr:methyltransferase domain-containing protein [Thermoanaerobaculia bacterium]